MEISERRGLSNTRDRREQGQGRLEGEHVDKEQAILCSLDQTVEGKDVWGSCSGECFGQGLKFVSGEVEIG